MNQLQYLGLASFGASTFLLTNLSIRLAFPTMRILALLIHLFFLSVAVLSLAQVLRQGKFPGLRHLAFALILTGGLLAWI